MEIRQYRLGEILQKLGYVSEGQVQQALEYKRVHPGVRIGDALIALNFITEKQMLEAISKSMDCRMVSLDQLHVHISAVARIPREMAERNLILATK